MFNQRYQHFEMKTKEAIRSGFSLIEILVTLMILGILTALVVAAMGPLLGNAKVAATQATIEQVGSVIQARYDAVMNADVSVEAKKLAALNSSLDQADAEYLIRMFLYRQALPQCPEDMFGMDLTQSTTANNAPYTSAWGGSNSSDDSAVTASEVFLFAITQGSSVRALPGGKSYPVPILELDNINQAHLTDIDGDGIDELSDEWGTPFRFYNFTTGLMTVSSGNFDVSNARILISGLPATSLSTSGPLSRDPFDASGTHFSHLQGEFTNSPTNMTYRTGGGTTTTPVASMASGSLLDNYYHSNRTFTPLLVSAGPDETLGLAEPTAGDSSRLCVVSSTADLTDNLTNRQQ